MSPDRQQYRVELDAGLRDDTSVAADPVTEVDGSPFRVAVIGDFSGRANRGVAETGR